MVVVFDATFPIDVKDPVELLSINSGTPDEPIKLFPTNASKELFSELQIPVTPVAA